MLGLGPVGQFVLRIGAHHEFRELAVDPVPERRAMAESHGILTDDLTDTVVDELRDLTCRRSWRIRLTRSRCRVSPLTTRCLTTLRSCTPPFNARKMAASKSF